MRSRWFTAGLKRVRYDHGFGMALPAFAADDLWPAEALREARLVRRVLRGARTGTNGAVGTLAALDALERGAVSEVLLSRRFIESEPASAATVSRLAVAGGASITTVSGMAELELDLVGGGIAALLRRALRRTADRNSDAPA